ncbi:tyrosine--tRNA ligase [Microbacterium sp. NPDC096154]|uniref:tyrosine--tRNA ligase n=1 Tax=Microbacterium sp. NPDC096154 TaxID=3155549 RepID=UPI00332C02CD
MTTLDQVLEHLSRRTDQSYGRDDLRDRLVAGRPLRIKFGVDCTAPDLHLEHAVNLWMMRYLQDLGQVVVFLLGDITTRIGDPTGRSTTRPVLTAEQIERNAQAFLEQVSMVLRKEPAVLEIRRNAEWFDTMPITELLGELSLVPQGRLMSRDMFQSRVEERREIAMHELIYPVLQGFDSVALRLDITHRRIRPTVQWDHGAGAPGQAWTATADRHHEHTHARLDGGPKQSKSLGNYVGLAQPAEEKFGRLMTLNDDLIGLWAKVYTELPFADVSELARRASLGGVQARDAKLDLAEAIVARHHGASPSSACSPMAGSPRACRNCVCRST